MTDWLYHGGMYIIWSLLPQLLYALLASLVIAGAGHLLVRYLNAPHAAGEADE